MKTISKIIGSMWLAAVALAANSCAVDGDYDNDRPISDISVGIGNIAYVKTDGAFGIYTDERELLNVTENLAVDYAVTPLQRVLFSYTVLEQLPQLAGRPVAYNVRINSFADMVTGEPVPLSDACENGESALLGNDGVYVDKSWFGGEYINIEYRIYKTEGREHRISLLWNDTASGSDTIYLELRHNAFADLPGASDYSALVSGMGSFPIADLLPAGASRIVVRLGWNRYDDDLSGVIPAHSTGVFVPWRLPDFVTGAGPAH